MEYLFTVCEDVQLTLISQRVDWPLAREKGVRQDIQGKRETQKESRCVRDASDTLKMLDIWRKGVVTELHDRMLINKNMLI